MEIEWTVVSAFAALISGLTSVILCYQLVLIKKQVNVGLEADRNVYSNECIKWWLGRQASQSSAARLLVEKFNHAQAKALSENRMIEIHLPKNEADEIKFRSDTIERLKGCLGESFKQITFESDIVKIGPSESATIRYLCMEYLNATEIVLSAWRHNLVNQKIIEEEFSFVVHGNSEHRMLFYFREASGGTGAFPAIYDFITKMERRRVGRGTKRSEI